MSLKLKFCALSARRDDRVEQVTNGDIVAHYLALDAVNFGLLFSYFFFEVSELVVKRLDDLFSYMLLLLEFHLTFHRLFLPILILLTHTIDIIRHEINTLSQRIRALT